MENTELALVQNPAYITPVGISAATGLLLVEAKQFKPDGFFYEKGYRVSHGLMIVEEVAEGTGCTYLCSIRVYDAKTSKLMCDIAVPRSTYYSRQTVMELVHQHLCEAIGTEAIRNGLAMDEADVEAQVGEMLDDCYFGECRRAALSWAVRVGIIS